MTKNNKGLKSFLLNAIKDLVLSSVNDEKEEKVEEIEDDFEDEKVKIVNEVENLKKIQPSVNKVVPVTSSTGRIINLGDNWYYCKNIKATTFCNKEDFKGERYQLATNAPWPYVYRDKMKGVRGISLPNVLDKNLRCTVIHKKSGVSREYQQVDVGPGWTNDPFWEKGTNPKNELGKDYLGNRSVLAGVDFFPQVWEDLGIMSFEDAYNGSPSGIFDLLIYDPSNVPVTKTVGHEIPSKDPRPWVSELPDTGSEFFSWRELLRGWNLTTRPPQKTIDNLLLLTKEILHPARIALGPLRLGSVLRDPATNSRVGGRAASFHLTGRAADITPINVSFQDVHNWLTANISKNKLRENVWEFPNNPNEHVHVAVKLDPSENTNIRIKS